MAFSSTEKVAIRKWLGAPAPFHALTVRLDTLITSVEASVDTVTAVQGWLAQLTAIETARNALQDQMQILDSDEAKFDAIRGDMGLCRQGRYYVGLIAQTLTFPPLRDVFAPPRIGSWSQVQGLP